MHGRQPAVILFAAHTFLLTLHPNKIIEDNNETKHESIYSCHARHAYGLRSVRYRLLSSGAAGDDRLFPHNARAGLHEPHGRHDRSCRRSAVHRPLTDKYGRKRILVGSMLLFVVASLLCIFSGDIFMFNAMRVLQGLPAREA